MSFGLFVKCLVQWCLLDEETNVVPWAAAAVTVLDNEDSDDDGDDGKASSVHEDWTELQVISGTAAVTLDTETVTFGTAVVTCSTTDGSVLYVVALGTTHKTDVSSVTSVVRSCSTVTSLVVTSSTGALSTSMETKLWQHNTQR